MNPQAVFGISTLLNLVTSIVVAKLYAWPLLRNMNRIDSLKTLVAPHLFLRFIGLSFIMPGVVSSTLPAGFAVPAAYGDLIAGLLAIVATIALARGAAWAIASVWLFNIEGMVDLLFAGVQGVRTHIEPGALGASFFLVTSIVPALLVTHALIFGALVLKPQKAAAERYVVS